MKHLYFVRHGKSEMNQLNIYVGRTDDPLSTEGTNQAKTAGAKAKDLHIDYIISSPLARAHDTAKHIAEMIGYPEDKIETSALLVERDFGSMEGRPWSPGFNMDGVADAETAESLRNRVQLIWEHLKSVPAENILVVSHGSTGRMLRHIANPNIPFNSTGTSHHLRNAEIVQFL